MYLIKDLEENTLYSGEDLDLATDIMLLNLYKKRYPTLELPEDLLYADYVFDYNGNKSKISLYKQLFGCKEIYIGSDDTVFFSTMIKNITTLTLSEKEFFFKKEDFLSVVVKKEYLELWEVAEKSLLNLKKSDLPKLYGLANQKGNHLSKVAFFALKKFNNCECIKEDIFKFYGSEEKAVNAMGSLITKLNI